MFHYHYSVSPGGALAQGLVPACQVRGAEPQGAPAGGRNNNTNDTTNNTTNQL